jgi:hypothetical protein
LKTETGWKKMEAQGVCSVERGEISYKFMLEENVIIPMGEVY